MSDKIVLAIDPGSAKCGLAIVKRHQNGTIELLWRRIAPRESLSEALRAALNEQPYSLVIVGSGTRSREIVKEIRDALPSMAVLVVDERDTTLQARERYWEHNERRGWRRLLPASMQVPPEPVDDYVAMILAERVLSP